jgi:hypothetical protein
VLVITNDHDEHADAVVKELEKRAVPVFRFHPEEFPGTGSISMEIRNGRIDGEIRTARQQVALHDICAAWYRRSRALFAPLPSLNLLYGDVENFVRVQAGATLSGLFDGEEGARLPLTTILPRGHALDSVALSPNVFQPYIEKAYELRCVVMGERIFTAKLDSQAHASTRTDWRAGDVEDETVRHEVFDLPEPVQAGLHRLMRSFGINFASIDMIVTPQGEFVFLDLNPNGQWLWLEEELGLPLVAGMADLLTREYSPATEAASAVPLHRFEPAHGT